MGKASKWFRGLFGLRKPDPNPNPNPDNKPPPKKKWSFNKAHKERDHPKPQHTTAPSGYDDRADASRRAIAVAAATAAVADAAVAAAQAAAAVVKLTSSAGGNPSTAGSGGGGSNSAAHVSQNGTGHVSREVRAAVKIQSHFRAYLARRALRALKALVKLQALAKGYICRKQFTLYLQQLHAIARVQERARVGRALNSEASQNSSTKSSNYNKNSPETPEKFEYTSKSTKNQHQMTLKRNVLKSNGENLIHDRESIHSTRNRWTGRQSIEKPFEQGSFTRMDGDKILEVDTGNPTPKYRNMFHSSHLSNHYYCQSFSNHSGEAQSFVEASDYFCTAENSPLYYSVASSRRGPLTPTKSDGSKSNVSGFYMDHPSYMAYTESSKAKVRSVSAPKQRPANQYERLGSSTNRFSVHGFGGNSNNESRVNNNKVTAMHASFTSKAYPGSGRLDRLGMPVRDFSGFSGGGHNWQRY
ncbi:Protein of unknown function (DUF4005) [Castilleja foliolosa]|uniref:DUF4005 domain-containing protein n=1 Tax=Castilleja foliolosa TaxID=1961234 RepID=A0ABD3DXQ3_9LAMI